MLELDNPVWWAIIGPQRALGTLTPLAARFHQEISPFGGFAEDPTDDHWNDLAGLVGPGGRVALTGETGSPPSGWKVLRELSGVQMVGGGIRPGAAGSGDAASSGSAIPANATPAVSQEDNPVPLGRDDVDDMLALVARTQPGPFLPRTIEFGGYLGIRRQGRLVAMAGQRLRPPGYTEVSAVATDPGHRCQGLAESLTRAVVAAIQSRGEIPFLHVDSGNAAAIRLYQSIGFARRRAVSFLVLQAPGAD